MSIDKRLAIKPALNQFNGGEIAPQLEGRYDWDKYNYSAMLCKNFIPTVEGYLKRRGGSHFVSSGVEAPAVDIMFSIMFDVEFEHISDVPYVTMYIDGEYVEVPHQFPTITIVRTYDEGTVLHYTLQADGFVPISGMTVVEPSGTLLPKIVQCNFISITNSATLTIVPDPENADVRINGIATRTLTVEKNSTARYSVSYSGKTVSNTVSMTEDKTLNINVPFVVFKSNVPQLKTVSFADGYYTVKVIGAGGGAGGGSYGDGHKHAGNGGGSGAGFVGVIRLSGNKNIKVGSKGMGGTNGRKGGNSGYDGEDSYIGNVIKAGGGKKGAGARSGSAGAGGTLTLNATIKSYTVSSNGNAGSGERGGAALVDSYGKGGNGVYKETGSAGNNGYIEITYYGVE